MCIAPTAIANECIADHTVINGISGRIDRKILKRADDPLNKMTFSDTI